MSEPFNDYRDPSWPKGLYLRKQSYRYRRHYNGHRIIHILGEIPLQEAIRSATRKNLDLEEDKPIVNEQQKVVTFAKFAAGWLSKKSAEVRPSSLSRYRAVIENFSAYLETNSHASKALDDITYAIAFGYITHRGNSPIMPNGHKKFTRSFRDGVKKATLHFERNTLMSIFKEVVKHDLSRKNPFEDVKAKKPSKQELLASHHALSEEEETRLLVAAKALDVGKKDEGNPNFYDVVFFLLKTGLREDELRNLEWTDVDWEKKLINIKQKDVVENRTIPIPDSALEGLKKRIKHKANDERVFHDKKDVQSFGIRLNIRTIPELLALKVKDIDLSNRIISSTRAYTWQPKASQGQVPMCNSVMALLQNLKKRSASNFIFSHNDGGSCRIDIWELLKAAQKKAGIQGRLRVHDLRHTVGMRLRQRGVPLEAIMGILRHADIKETLIYAPYRIEEGKDAICKLDDTPTDI